MAFAAFNIAISSWFTTSVSNSDEYGVLTAANWFSGGPEWGPKMSLYYGYAHSILYAPLFAIFDNLLFIYVAALGINSLLVALIPVFCFKTLNGVVGYTDKTKAAWISAVAGLYPVFTYFSKRTQNETLLFVILFACVYLVGKNLTTESKALFRFNSVLLGFLPAVCYAAHGLGLSYPLALCLCILLTRLVCRKDVVNYLLFGVSLVGFFLLDNVMKGLVKSALYAADTGLRNTFLFNLQRMLPSLFTLDGLKMLFRSLLAKLHYLSSASFGLFLLALAMLVVIIWRWFRQRKRHRLDASLPNPSISPAWFGMVTFILLILLGGVGISTLNSLPYLADYGGSYYFYGRYYEYLMVPLIMFALYFLATAVFSKKTLLCLWGAASGAYVIISILTQIAVIPGVLKDDAIIKTHVTLGTTPFIGIHYAMLNPLSMQPKIYNLLILGAVTLAVFGVFMLLCIYKKQGVALLLIGCMFAYVTFFDLGTMALRASNQGYVNTYHWLNEMRVSFDRNKTLQALYKEYPELYVFLSTEAKKNRNLRAQLGFNDYTVRSGTYDPEYDYENAIILTDPGSPEIFPGPDWVLVSSDGNLDVWLAGEEIIARYYELGGTGITPETDAPDEVADAA